jgi:hypothetical protein
MYTVADISARYSVNEHTVLGWIRRGELVAINVGRTPHGRKPRWRISEQALSEFEAKRTPTPAAPRKRKAKADGVVQFY